MSKFYDELKKFSKEVVLPAAEDTDKKGEFPVEVFKKLGEEGYFGLLIPETYGGKGKTIVEHQEAVLALAESCPTVGLCYMMHNVALMTILNYGSEELKKKIFSDVIENKKFLALAYSEFGTGTHFYIPEIKAEKVGDKTKFNGTKSMVTSATHASYYLILTPAETEGQINNWVVPVDAEGVSFDMNSWDGLGMRGNVSCPMNLKDVELDQLYKIGADGSGQEQVFNVVAPYFILGLSSVYTGLNLRLSEVVNAHALSRKYGESSLASIETVQIHLSKVYSMAQASKALSAEAAKSLLEGAEDALPKVIAARIVASENAIEASRIAMRVGGGKTYNKATEIERLLRDSYAGQIMAPSVDVLILWLGRAITGQDLL